MANVVVLPEPVMPDTITRPLRKCASRSASSKGNPAHSKSGIAAGITRKQAPKPWPLRKQLARKRCCPPAQVELKREVGVLFGGEPLGSRSRQKRQQHGLYVSVGERANRGRR